MFIDTHPQVPLRNKIFTLKLIYKHIKAFRVKKTRKLIIEYLIFIIFKILHCITSDQTSTYINIGKIQSVWQQKMWNSNTVQSTTYQELSSEDDRWNKIKNGGGSKTRKGEYRRKWSGNRKQSQRSNHRLDIPAPAVATPRGCEWTALPAQP